MDSLADYLKIALAVLAIFLAFKLTASILGLALRLVLVFVLLGLAAYWLGILPSEYVTAASNVVAK
jgi:hypothetical protein